LRAVVVAPAGCGVARGWWRWWAVACKIGFFPGCFFVAMHCLRDPSPSLTSFLHFTPSSPGVSAVPSLALLVSAVLLRSRGVSLPREFSTKLTNWLLVLVSSYSMPIGLSRCLGYSAYMPYIINWLHNSSYNTNTPAIYPGHDPGHGLVMPTCGFLSAACSLYYRGFKGPADIYKGLCLLLEVP
jgi:hypothetical protein